MHKKKTLPNTIEDCNAQQIHILSSLRARIREAGYPESSYNDPYLLRFLCAKKFDVEKTLQMWKNFIDWRKTRNIDQVISMELPEMVQIKPYHPHMWLRTDKMGRPIYIERIGKLNLDKILKAVPAESLELYFIRDYERLLQEKFPACSKAYGETVNSTCYIMDLKGAASNIMSPKMWELLKIASKIGQEYYPETLGDMIVVNAPMWCYGAWNVIKHLLDEKTRTRVHIFGTNYKKDLLKYVDEENLPDFLGGKIPEEEYGPNMTNEQGPWVKSVVEEKAPEKEEKEEKEAKSADGANSPVENDIILGMTRSPVSELEEDEENFDELDIAQELPTKHAIKNLMARPSTEFSYVTVGHRFS